MIYEVLSDIISSVRAWWIRRKRENERIKSIIAIHMEIQPFVELAQALTIRREQRKIDDIMNELSMGAKKYGE